MRSSLLVVSSLFCCYLLALAAAADDITPQCIVVGQIGYAHKSQGTQQALERILHLRQQHPEWHGAGKELHYFSTISEALESCPEQDAGIHVHVWPYFYQENLDVPKHVQNLTLQGLKTPRIKNGPATLIGYNHDMSSLDHLTLLDLDFFIPLEAGPGVTGARVRGRGSMSGLNSNNTMSVVLNNIPDDFHMRGCTFLYTQEAKELVERSQAIQLEEENSRAAQQQQEEADD